MNTKVFDGCTESNCTRCLTEPYARGDMLHAGIGSYPPGHPHAQPEPDPEREFAQPFPSSAAVYL